MLKKYRPFFKASTMNTFAYKFSIYTWLLISVVSILCVFFLWTAVFQNSPTEVINGFTFKEIISYTVIITIFTFTINGADTLGTICDEIRKGQIEMYLIKPISYRLRFIYCSLGDLFAVNLILGIPTLLISCIFFVSKGYMIIGSVPHFISNILLFFLSQIFATLLLDSINFFLGIVAFYTYAIFGIIQIKNCIIGFLSGQLLPIAFFPDWARQIIEFSPFVGIAQNPALILLGKMTLKEEISAILLQILWLGIFETINHFFYNHSIKKITIQGG